MIIPIKIQEEMELDLHDLLVKSKINGLDLIYCLRDRQG